MTAAILALLIAYAPRPDPPGEESWLLRANPAADLIGEMLGDFSLDDALSQCEAMSALCAADSRIN